MEQRIKVIGLTGGIGSGKSTVAAIAKEEFHAAVIMTDDVARDQMMPGGVSYNAVIQSFGTSFLNPDQTINRALLAKIIFASEDNVKRINEITHPNVRTFVEERIRELNIGQTHKAVIVETALLFEAKFDTMCDQTWFVYASEETRRERLKQSRGYSDEKITSILSKQDDEYFFRTHCSHIILNDGDTTREEIIAQLERLLAD